MFDEVEFLVGWQKNVVYSFLPTAPPPLSAKIATLPYAHRFALEEADASLLEGSDFDEVALSLTAELEFKNDEDEETSASFSHVCEGIWRARLEQSGFDFASLQDVWPKHELVDVLEEIGVAAIATGDDLRQALIQDLPEGSRPRAQGLRIEDARGVFRSVLAQVSAALSVSPRRQARKFGKENVFILGLAHAASRLRWQLQVVPAAC